MKNPIIDNRIVSDKTFATRLVNFIDRTDVNDPWSEEEKEYLLRVAKDLQQYQFQTVADEAEGRYFLNIGYNGLQNR